MLVVEDASGVIRVHGRDEIADAEISDGAVVIHFCEYDANVAAQKIAESISKNPMSYDAAMLICAEELRAGHMPPKPLLGWLCSVLEGEISRPKFSSKPKGMTDQRDALICQLINTLVRDMGLFATSSDRINGTSACHAVAQAFTHLRLQPSSYEHMASVWKEKEKNLTIEVP